MAEIHSSVEAARKAIWGDVADAHCLVGLARSSQDDEAVAHLAVSILERLLASVESFEIELTRHGFPPLSARAPASGDVEL